MVVAQTLSKASRSWPLVVLAGAIGFVAGFSAFLGFGAGWIVRLLADDSAAVARTVMALLGDGRTLSFDETDAVGVALCHAFTWRA